MAEPSAVAPRGAGVSGQDVLLATKLHVPRPQPGFVPRPRLVEALGEGLARRLILVCAPAGSGKTALLADWAPSGNRPVAWLSLDVADKSWFYAPKDLGWDLKGAVSGMGDRVRLTATIEELVQNLTAEARPGDHVLIMSNGGFGGLHDKLLAALRAR